MKALLALAVPLLLSVTPTVFSDRVDLAGPLWSDATPPVRFQGPGLAITAFLPVAEMQAVCGETLNPPDGVFIRACTKWLKTGEPVIVLPLPCDFDGEEYGHLVCHELAHAAYNWDHETP